MTTAQLTKTPPFTQFNEFDQVVAPVNPGTVRFLMDLSTIPPLSISSKGTEVSFRVSALRPHLSSKDADAAWWLNDSERDLLYHGWLSQGYSPAVSIHFPIVAAQEGMFA